MKGYLREDEGFGIVSFLPADLDTSNLIPITTIGDRWSKYLDTTTGKVHDSEAYYKQMLEEQKDDQC